MAIFENVNVYEEIYKCTPHVDEMSLDIQEENLEPEISEPMELKEILETELDTEQDEPPLEIEEVIPEKRRSS